MIDLDLTERLRNTENIREYKALLSRVDPENLLNHFAQTPETAAGVFLLFSAKYSNAVHFFDLLINHLIKGGQTTRDQIIKWKKLVSIQINSTATSEFQNTLLHHFIVHEKWPLAQNLIDTCKANGIELTQVCKKDINGLTSLDLAIRLDVTPDELIKSMFSLYMKQLRAIGSQDDKPHSETPHPLLSSMILMYQFKKRNLLTWLKESYPNMYSILDKAIKKQSVTFLTEKQYSAILSKSCVYSQRSAHATSNFLYIKTPEKNNYMLFFKNDDQAINILTNPPIQQQSLITYPIDENESKSYNFFVLNKNQAPWDPLFTHSIGNLKVLTFRLENILLLCHFFNRRMLKLLQLKHEQSKENTTFQVIKKIVDFATNWFSRKVLVEYLKSDQPASINSNDPIFQTLEGSFRDRKTPKLINDTELRLNDQVEIHGLLKNTIYNTQTGKVIRFGDDDRVIVKLTANSTNPGKVIAVKIINCRKIMQTSSQTFSEHDEKQANPGVTL